MALRNYNTREENEMQDLTQKQIDLSGFSEKEFSQEQINQIYEKEAPALFVPNVFSFATDGKRLRYGSVRMPIGMAKNRRPSSAKKVRIRSLFVTRGTIR